ncbi:hypothetical protein P7K49_002706 [Saguinus oedipus]|uniref:Uncharacterized protein n=1 Tax=Saguinus oedipus TaxID=9490 RepID=A0ABQ9WIN1_SAGOE|nr:hypothetical protein P7K49_002706 [Saguinus oedipus]
MGRRPDVAAESWGFAPGVGVLADKGGKQFAPLLELRQPRGPRAGERCRALQAPDPSRDYFSLMDWYERRFRKTCLSERDVEGWPARGKGRSGLRKRRRN